MLTMAMLLVALSESTAQADSVADFYRTRPVSVIVGFEPGSGNDLLTRMVAKYMRDRIPRKPTIVVQNMPGAGSLKAAKFLNEVAPRDGSTLGFIGRGVLLAPLLEPSMPRSTCTSLIGLAVQAKRFC
jgi:tripartite-type tricarboxylate transporter receptor subunit TctC